MVKLLLVMPATSAQSERSFSAIQRIKIYLRATISQQQLNHLMFLHFIFKRVKLMPLISWTLPVTSFVDMSTERMFLVPRLSQVFNLMLLKLFLLLLSLFMYNSLLFQK